MMNDARESSLTPPVLGGASPFRLATSAGFVSHPPPSQTDTYHAVIMLPALTRSSVVFDRRTSDLCVLCAASRPRTRVIRGPSGQLSQSSHILFAARVLPPDGRPSHAGCE